MPLIDLRNNDEALRSGNPGTVQKVAKFIDDVTSFVIKELLKPDGCPSITLNRRSSQFNSHSLNMKTGALEADNAVSPCQCTYSWPGKTMYEGWRFGKLLAPRSFSNISITTEQ